MPTSPTNVICPDCKEKAEAIRLERINRRYPCVICGKIKAKRKNQICGAPECKDLATKHLHIKDGPTWYTDLILCATCGKVVELLGAARNGGNRTYCDDCSPYKGKYSKDGKLGAEMAPLRYPDCVKYDECIDKAIAKKRSLKCKGCKQYRKTKPEPADAWDMRLGFDGEYGVGGG